MGQSLSYLTAGQAARVLADPGELTAKVSEVLAEYAWRRTRPLIIDRQSPEDPGTGG